MKLLLLGAPGSGKGTQGAIISEKQNIPVISTGDMLRAAIREGTEIGLKAKSFIDAGGLVPDEVVVGIVKERLAKDDCKNGYILDGFPRTIPQAEALDAVGLRPEIALSIDVSDENIEKRMTGRRVCPKCDATFHIESKKPQKDGACDACDEELIIRTDDAPETVRSRLKTYHEQTEPLLDYYKDILKRVNGANDLAETTARVAETLGL